MKGSENQMLSPSDIQPAVREVLLSTSDRLASYQILDRLPQPLRDQIISERGMPGAGSGNSYSSASLVTDAVESILPSLDEPYRLYLKVEGVTFQVAGQTITPGNPSIAYYRILKQSEIDQKIAAPVLNSAKPIIQNSKVKLRWYERGGTLVLWFIFFWPVGVYGLFKNSKVPKAVKVIVPSFFALPVFLAMISSFASGGTKVGGGSSSPRSEAVSTIVEATPEPLPEQVKHAQILVTKDGFFSSSSTDSLDRAVEYAVHKDLPALQKALDSGSIAYLKPGLHVRIVDHIGFFASLVKVRPVGETTEFWTLNGALTSQ